MLCLAPLVGLPTGCTTYAPADGSPPSVEILAPASGEVLPVGDVLLCAYVLDPSFLPADLSATVEIQGEEIGAPGSSVAVKVAPTPCHGQGRSGNFAWWVEYLSEGAYELVLKMRSPQGAEGQDVVEFELEATPPPTPEPTPPAAGRHSL